MGSVYQMGANSAQEEIPAGMTGIEKMQLAVQIAALVRASFKRPTESDVSELLQMTANQLSPLPSDRG